MTAVVARIIVWCRMDGVVMVAGIGRVDREQRQRAQILAALERRCLESPQFIAFCATRYGGIDYPRPALFTARSLDGKPIAESSKVRIYHGFGDRRIKLFGKQFEVAREEVVRIK